MGKLCTHWKEVARILIELRWPAVLSISFMMVVVAHIQCYGFAVGERPASQLWCAQDQSATLHPIERNSVAQALDDRVSDPDNLPVAVVVCARYEDPRDLRPNDGWHRRMVAELIFEIDLPDAESQEDANSRKDLGGFVRLYKEVRPPDSESWRFDGTFAVRWQPVKADSSQEALDYVIREMFGASGDEIQILARSVF